MSKPFHVLVYGDRAYAEDPLQHLFDSEDAQSCAKIIRSLYPDHELTGCIKVTPKPTRKP